MFNCASKVSSLVVLVLMMAGCASSGGIDPAVGNWDIVSVSALGTAEQTIVINGDMTGVLQAQVSKAPWSSRMDPWMAPAPVGKPQFSSPCR